MAGVGTRIARNPETGKTYNVPSDMTYEQWKKKSLETVEKSEKSGIIGMNRNANNTGVFSSLPEKMSKKHIREIALEYNIDIKGLSFEIDDKEDFLDKPFTGCANPNKIGNIIFFPSAFSSREELVRTLYHEKIRVQQFKDYGAEFVKNNREHFETLAYKAEDVFMSKFNEKG